MGVSFSNLWNVFVNSNSKTPPFPLFKLPSLAIYEVLKEMKPLELVILSSVSKKTGMIMASFAKRYSSKTGYKLKVDYENLEMELYCEKTETLITEFKATFQRRLKNSQFSNILINVDDIREPVEINSDKHIITTYWENDLDNYKKAVKTMLQYFCRIFNPVIDCYDHGKPMVLFEVLDVIKKENAKLDEVSFSGSFVNGEIYQKCLDLSIRKLDLVSFSPFGFHYKPSVNSMKFDELNITYADWVTSLNKFLNCKSVVLENTKLKIRDLKKFLNEWMVSDCKLEFLNVQMNEPNLRKIVRGLLVQPLKRVEMANHLEEFENGKCYSLQRRNGERAIIYQDENSIILQTESYQRP